MLDLNHPLTKHVFAAARAEDEVLLTAKRMTVSARQERVRLRDGCNRAFAELRHLAVTHFRDRPAILPTIEALERALGELSALARVPEQGPPAEHKCPVCGAALDRSYCSQCLDIIMPSLSALRSWEDGFGTDAI